MYRLAARPSLEGPEEERGQQGQRVSGRKGYEFMFSLTMTPSESRPQVGQQTAAIQLVSHTIPGNLLSPFSCYKLNMRTGLTRSGGFRQVASSIDLMPEPICT